MQQKAIPDKNVPTFLWRDELMDELMDELIDELMDELMDELGNVTLPRPAFLPESDSNSLQDCGHSDTERTERLY